MVMIFINGVESGDLGSSDPGTADREGSGEFSIGGAGLEGVEATGRHQNASQRRVLLVQLWEAAVHRGRSRTLAWVSKTASRQCFDRGNFFC